MGLVSLVDFGVGVWVFLCFCFFIFVLFFFRCRTILPIEVVEKQASVKWFSVVQRRGNPAGGIKKMEDEDGARPANILRQGKGRFSYLLDCFGS